MKIDTGWSFWKNLKWPDWKDKLTDLAIPVIAAVLGAFIVKLAQSDIKTILIMFETILILIGLIVSCKKFKAMYFFYQYGPHRGYRLVRVKGANKVYLIADGYKRWVKEPVTLYELGYDMNTIDNTISQEELDSYREKFALSIYWFSEIG